MNTEQRVAISYLRSVLHQSWAAGNTLIGKDVNALDPVVNEAVESALKLGITAGQCVYVIVEEMEVQLGWRERNK